MISKFLPLLLVASGCGLFEPREPTPPDTGGEIPEECRFNVTVSELEVLTNLITAFGCGTNGIDMFQNSHEPDVDFVPSDSDDGTVIETLNGWTGRDDAVTAFSQQIDDEREFVLSFDDIDELVATSNGDRRVFEDVLYRLEIRTGTTTDASFGGTADIFLFQGSNGWALVEWRDGERADADNGTLGNFYVNGPPAGP